MATFDEYIQSIYEGLDEIKNHPNSEEWLFVVREIDSLIWGAIADDEEDPF